jgi:hypothetical protein
VPCRPGYPPFASFYHFIRPFTRSAFQSFKPSSLFRLPSYISSISLRTALVAPFIITFITAFVTPTTPTIAAPSSFLTSLLRLAFFCLAALDDMLHTRSAPRETRKIVVSAQVIRLGCAVDISSAGLVLGIAGRALTGLFGFFACVVVLAGLMELSGHNGLILMK